MKLADWDWFVVAGIVALATGLWWLWGPGAALVCVGAVLIVAGIGGALGKKPDEA